MTTERLVIQVDEKGSRTVKRNIAAIGTTAKVSAGGVNMLKMALATIGVASLGMALTSSTRQLASFSQTMSTVKAVSKATEDQFEAMRNKAKQLGETTRFSATQAGEGMLFLARAGFDANENLASIENTLKLAQAGALDLGAAADIASNILAGFRGDVDQLTRTVDVLALAANSSNTNIQQLGQGMKFVAPVAAGLGVSLESTAAAIGVLSDAGLQAQMAGTGLRKILSTLERPTGAASKILKELGLRTDQVKVSQIGLVAAMKNLRQAGIDTGQGLALFGQRGGPAFDVLVNMIPELEIFTDNLQDAGGTADRISEIMDDNLNGALLRVRSALEAVNIEFGDLGAESTLTKLMEGLATLLRALAHNLGTVIKTVASFGAAWAAVKLGGLAATIAKSVTSFIAMRRAVAAGNAVMLGSAAADKMKALAVVETTKAEVANTAAVLLKTKAQMANAIVLRGSTTAEFARIALLKQVTILEGQHAAALTAHASAQTAVAGTTKKSIPIIGGLVTGIRSGAAALMAFLGPVGLIVAAVVALVAGFVLWGDKIKVASGHTASLKDVLRVLVSYLKPVWEWMKKLGGWTGSGLKRAWQAVFGDMQLNIGEFFRFTAWYLDRVIGLWMGAFNAVKVIWKGLPAAMKDVFAKAMNSALASVETGLNAMISALNFVREKLGQDPLGLVTLTRLDNKNEGAAKELGKQIAEAMRSGMEQDMLFSFVEDVLNKADALGAKRAAEATAAAAAAGGGKDEVIVGGTAARFDQYLAQLKKEGQLLQLSNRERSVQHTLLQVQEQFNDELTVSQLGTIEAMLRQNAQWKLQSELLEGIRGPQLAFEAGQAALGGLLETGRINLAEYNKELKRLWEETHPAEAAHSKLIDTLEREIALLQTPLVDRKISGQLAQADPTGSMTPEQRAGLEHRLRHLQSLREEAAAYEAIKGPQLAYQRQVAAMDRLLASGIINSVEYKDAIKELKDAMSGTRDIDVMEQAWGSLWNNSLGALNDFAETGKFVFKDFANSMINDIQRIVQQQLLLMAFRAMGLPVPGYQYGGSFIVGGSGGPDSQLVAFRGTPGERVDITPPGQPTAPGAAAGAVTGGTAEITIINVLDPDLVPDALETEDGSQAVVNVISRKSNAVKRVLV